MVVAILISLVLMAPHLYSQTQKYPGAERPEFLVIVENPGQVHSVAFSPDGKVLVSAGQAAGHQRVRSPEGIVRLWDLSSATLQRVLTGHRHWVNSVAFSGDGKILASGSSDGTVSLWYAGSGALLRTIGGLQREIGGFEREIESIAFSPDGKALAGADGKGIRLWDIQTAALRRVLSVAEHWPSKVAFSPNGSTLASGGEGSGQGEVVLWNARKAEPTKRLVVPEAAVNAVAFSLDGAHLASASGDKIRLWRVETGELLQTWTGDAGLAASVAFSPDGGTLASGSGEVSYGGEVTLWDVRTGKMKRRLKGHKEPVHSVCFSPIGNLLASGDLNGAVKLWDSSTGRNLVTFQTVSWGKVAETVTGWLAYTPEGYYHGSAGSQEVIRWGLGDKVLPANAYENTFRRPDIVQKAVLAAGGR